MTHGLGRKEFSSVFRLRRIARGLALFGLAAAGLLAAGNLVRSQDDARDLIELRRRNAERERRVVDRDLDRERRLDDREYNSERRPDPAALERRTKLYRDLKKDFSDFGKNDFDRGPDRRPIGIDAPAIVNSPETLERVRRIFDRMLAQDADALQVALNNDVDLMRGVRSVLHDVIQFSARAQVLAETCRRAERVGTLSGDFEAFDRDWQAISYKLRRIPELAQSRPSSASTISTRSTTLSATSSSSSRTSISANCCAPRRHSPTSCSVWLRTSASRWSTHSCGVR